MNDMVKFDEVKAELAEYGERNATMVFDYADPEGEKEARGYVFQLRKLKGRIAAKHKEVKADALAYGRKVDAIKNTLTTAVEKMIDVHTTPLKEIEDARQAEIDAKVKAVKLEEERIENERLETLRKREEEINRKEAEIKAKEEAIAQAEYEKKMKIEQVKREKRIAEEARKDAIIQAEYEKQRAIDKAEREKNEAVEAEKEKASKIEVERLADEDAKRAKANRLAKIEADRISDEKHRDKIESKVCSQIRETINEYVDLEGYDTAKDILESIKFGKTAKALLEAIKFGKIENVTINY